MLEGIRDDVEGTPSLAFCIAGNAKGQRGGPFNTISDAYKIPKTQDDM